MAEKAAGAVKLSTPLVEKKRGSGTGGAGVEGGTTAMAESEAVDQDEGDGPERSLMA